MSSPPVHLCGAQHSLPSAHNHPNVSAVLYLQAPVTVVGRVCCDGSGRLNAKSLLLEGSLDSSSGRRVSLDVSNVPQFSLFPGQVRHSAFSFMCFFDSLVCFFSFSQFSAIYGRPMESGRPLYFHPVVSFYLLSIFFFSCLISAGARWMSTILRHMVWP